MAVKSPASHRLLGTAEVCPSSASPFVHNSLRETGRSRMGGLEGHGPVSSWPFVGLRSRHAAVAQLGGTGAPARQLCIFRILDNRSGFLDVFELSAISPLISFLRSV